MSTEDRATAIHAGLAKRNFAKGNRSDGNGQALGKLEELGELVYKFNTKDQADMYLRTTDAIGEYVGREYGRHMRKLVKGLKETTFDKPEVPAVYQVTTRAKAAGADVEVDPKKDPIAMETYKEELRRYHTETERYAENKAKGLCDYSRAVYRSG